MAKLGINTGTSPDAGDGDALLTGAIKINSNFDEVYNLLGDGTNLAPGIVTSIVAGTNVTVSGSTGQVTINASSGGGTSSQWVTTDVGIHTLSNVGIGTTNATSVLTVQGSGRFNSSYLDVYNTSGTAGQFAYLRLAGSKLVGFDGTYFNIDANADYLNIKSDSGVRIGDDSTMFSGQVYANFYPNVLEFYAGGSEKLTVNSNGINVSGAVTATSFSGSGANLTNLPAGQLTGALPAIDGSALIGVVGSGSGVVIEDDATPVGTAGTINFGSNLSVSFASGIATVSGASSVSEATTAYALAGSPNVSLGNVTAGITTIGGKITLNPTLSNTILEINNTSTSQFEGSLLRLKNTTGTGLLHANLTPGGGAKYFQIQHLNSLDEYVKQLAIYDYQTESWEFFAGSSGNGQIYINQNGVGIGTTNVTSKLTVSGDTLISGVVTATSFSGSNTLKERTIVTGVTTSIANNGIGNTDITGFKSYALMKVGLSTAGWLRLYTDSTSRVNDASRSVGIDPAPGSGVIAEVVTTGISTTQIISPFVMGGNLDDPADTTIYAAITNLSGSTQAITANLTILQLEA